MGKAYKIFFIMTAGYLLTRVLPVIPTPIREKNWEGLAILMLVTIALLTLIIVIGVSLLPKKKNVKQ